MEKELHSKVNMLEKTIQLLLQKLETEEKVETEEECVSHPPYFCDGGCGKIMGNDDECKRICEDCENKPFDINDLISHLQEETYVDYAFYTRYNSNIDTEVMNWEEYVNDNLKPYIQQQLANGKIDTFLKDTYIEGSIKSITNKICSKIPEASIKVSDLSRSKASIYCDGKWLNQSQSKEKLEELIVLYQEGLSKLHHIYITCCDMYSVNMTGETFSNYICNTFQGNIKSKVFKSILTYYS